MRLNGRVVWVVLLGATLATAFSTTLAYQYVRSFGGEPIIWQLAELNATFWFAWAVLAIPLCFLSERVRIDRSPRMAVPVHISAVLLAGTAHVATQTFAQTMVEWQSQNLLKGGTIDIGAEWLRRFPEQLTRLVDWELFAGAGIIALAHAFFYYREAQRRALREAQLETRLIEAQLQTLQRQLQPHFLFNTLHAISALMHRDVQAADRTLAKLSDLLRLTLDAVGHPEIRLSEELEFLEKYVQIEQVRFADWLAIDYDVDADALDAIVPTLILQPLVENAIKHGIAPHGVPGRVTVSARRDRDMLVLTVDDTGPGPSEPALAALSTGIGVSNTRARLAHQFGARHRFEFQRRAGGFTVLVALPFRTEAVLQTIAR